MDENKQKCPPLATQSDIVRRWVFTRQGVRLRMLWDAEFPKPAIVVNNGRTSLWLLSDIIEYEKDRPFLTDETEKHAHTVRGFFRSQYYER